MPDVKIIFFALLGGILPAMFWLWFWLREDRLHPEPRSLIMISFLAGMGVVFLALPAERYAEKIISDALILVIAWSAIEEILKLLGAYFGGLHNREYDEPVDAMIYLITAALGFAALENTLFLISSINENIISGFVTGNLRFIGASLLHVLSSGVIGLFFAFSFYKGFVSKIVHLVFGVALAIGLHALFNVFIMKTNGGGTFIVFCFVWVSIILLLAAFEKVKRLSKIKL